MAPEHRLEDVRPHSANCGTVWEVWGRGRGGGDSRGDILSAGAVGELGERRGAAEGDLLVQPVCRVAVPSAPGPGVQGGASCEVLW